MVVQNILNTFQIFQGILLTVSAKQSFKSKKKSPKNNEAYEALSSQRSAGNWPFATLDGVCKTKTLDGELTYIEGSAEGPDDENICDHFYDDYYDSYYENYGCPGTTFCEKGNSYIIMVNIRINRRMTGLEIHRKSY